VQTQRTPDHRKLIAIEGHPGIFRRGGSCVVTWRHNGKLKKSSHRTLTEAKRAKAKRVAGDTTPPARQRFDTYARAWVKTYTGRTGRGVRSSTRASYTDAIARILIPHFGNARMEAITAPDVRALVDKLTDQGLASATIRRYLAPLRAMFAEAVGDGVLPRNPCDSIRVFVPGERRRKPRTLTPDLILVLLKAIPEAHRDLVTFLAFTGCRISEALAATWGDLRQENGAPVLVIPDSKTDAGVRSVPLAPGFGRQLLKRRASARWAADGDPIFPSATGTPIDARNWRRRVWAPAIKAAGVEATPHTLRHSLASLLFEQGHTAAQVAAWLGHEDPSFTLRTYVHARDVGDAAFLDDVLGASS
jgi:integrase